MRILLFWLLAASVGVQAAVEAERGSVRTIPVCFCLLEHIMNCALTCNLQLRSHSLSAVGTSGCAECRDTTRLIIPTAIPGH